MSRMRRSMRNQDHLTLRQVQAQQEQRKQREAVWECKRLRDEAIAKIHSLSYSRNGKLVPRRKEWRKELNAACMAARVYASLCRPDHGYPAPPRYDHEFPRPSKQDGNMDYTRLISERNRLTLWLAVLEERNADPSVQERVLNHIRRLNKKLHAMMHNDHVAKKGASFDQLRYKKM